MNQVGQITKNCRLPINNRLWFLNRKAFKKSIRIGKSQAYFRKISFFFKLRHRYCYVLQNFELVVNLACIFHVEWVHPIERISTSLIVFVICSSGKVRKPQLYRLNVVLFRDPLNSCCLVHFL